jgi:hypothetical protein
MIKIVKWYFLLLIVVFTSNSALASTISNPEQLIEVCNKQAHLKWDTGVTSTMQEGNVVYSDCLENTILKLTERIYDKDQQKEAKADLKIQFKQLSKAAIAFSWKIDNENKWCDCGTMAHVTSYSLYHRILEGMIKDMLSVEQFHTSQ